MPNRITFINHATVLIQFGKTVILTDPVYSWSVSYFLPRLKKPGIPFNSLPSVDLIAVSHNHYDHLNFRTLRRLRGGNQGEMVRAGGAGRSPRRLGFDRIHELKWWENVELNGITIT